MNRILWPLLFAVPAVALAQSALIIPQTGPANSAGSLTSMRIDVANSGKAKVDAVNGTASNLTMNGGTETGVKSVSGTVQNATITGGTMATTTISNTAISNSTISGGTIGTSAITGGTISGSTISSAAITGGSVTGTSITNPTFPNPSQVVSALGITGGTGTVSVGPGLTTNKAGQITLMGGTFGTQYSSAQIIRTGSQTITYGMNRVNVMSYDTSGVTYTFQSGMPVGAQGNIEQGNTGAITFSGNVGVSATTGQYDRRSWYSDGNVVIVK